MDDSPPIVVTGAAAGIGAAVVRRLLAAGLPVIGIDRSAANTPDLGIIHADLSDPTSIDVAVSQLPPRISALCNVAGVSGLVGADLTMRVNFLGLRHLTMVLEQRLSGGGSVVNVGSFAGVHWPQRKDVHLGLARTRNFDEGLRWLAANPVAENFAYPYSKEALRVWSQLQAARWIDRGIRMNVVNPGPVETAILSEFVTVLGNEKVNADIDRAGRAGTADEIARIIAWLTTAESAWVNGADIAVDGGLGATFMEETT